MKTHNKMVRDNVPKILESQGKKVDIETLDTDKGIEFLYLNLISTIYDGFKNKNLDNIADSIDILIAIAQEYGYTESEIINLRNKLKKEKGDYSKKILLKSTY